MTKIEEKQHRIHLYLAITGIVLGVLGILLGTTAPVFGPMLGDWLAG